MQVLAARPTVDEKVLLNVRTPNVHSVGFFLPALLSAVFSLIFFKNLFTMGYSLAEPILFLALAAALHILVENSEPAHKLWFKLKSFSHRKTLTVIKQFIYVLYIGVILSAFVLLFGTNLDPASTQAALSVVANGLLLIQIARLYVNSVETKLLVALEEVDPEKYGMVLSVKSSL